MKFTVGKYPLKKLRIELLWEDFIDITIILDNPSKMMAMNLVIVCIYLFNYQCEARIMHHLLSSDPYKQYAGK